MLKRTVPSGGARYLADFLPDQKAGGGQDGERLDVTSGENSNNISQAKEKDKDRR